MWCNRLPNCRLEVFPYVGHSMCIEIPLLLARVFIDFFKPDREAVPAAVAHAARGVVH